MNWKLISYLSSFGFIMAFATLSWVPIKYEPWFWLIIFIMCAYLIALKCPGLYFWNGLMVSLFNSIWITAAHLAFYGTYIIHHPEMQKMSAGMPLAEHPRLMMLLTGPVIGAASGVILGLFALIASRIVKRTPG